MASKSQKLRGVVLPEPVTGYDLICVRFKIPNHRIYKGAFRAQLERLALAGNWEMSYEPDDRRASQAARMFRKLIDEELIIDDCDELELFGGSDVAQFGVCWKLEECGYKLYYTLNGNCTETEVLDCDGNAVCFPQTLTPPNPIDEPVDTPNLGGWLSNCQLVNGVLHDLVTYRLYHFIGDILCNAIYVDGSVQAGRTALIAWLQDRAMMTNAYFEAFYALMQKYADLGCTLNSIYELEETMWSYLQCEGLLCMNGEITRSIMSCFADAIDGFSHPESNALQFAPFGAFFKDFVNIYPIEVLRRFAINLSPTTVDNDCSDCDVTPVNDCGVAFQYRWRGNPGMDFGWITLPDGAAGDWSIGDTDLSDRVFSPMSLADGWGWQLFTGQTQQPLYAGAVQLTYDDPFHLCEFMTVIYNSTNANNTRKGVAWARVAGTGTWVPLGHVTIPLGKQGVISIIWQGDLMVDRLLIAGATGGGYIRFQQVDVNWSMT